MSRLSPAQRAVLRHAATSRRRKPGFVRAVFPRYTVKALIKRGLVEELDSHVVLTEAGVAALEDRNDRRAQEITRRSRRRAA